MSPTLLVIQHVDREGPDLIGTLAAERGWELRKLRPDQGDSLPDPGPCRDTIALVLGGPMGVNERRRPDMAWLQRELDWLTAWHRQRKPVLGICLGAQLLAVAAGGSVEPLLVGRPLQQLKEVGFGAIHWMVHPDNEPLLKGLYPSETALHWHGDRIRLPADATLLGSSLHCAEQMFRIGGHAIGLQCHMEVTETSLERWILEDNDYLVNAMGEHAPDQLRVSWAKLGPGMEQRGRHLFNTLLSHFESLLSSDFRNRNPDH